MERNEAGYSTITSHRKGHIATITLNRPEAMNALSERMIDELLSELNSIRVDPGVRVLVITGAGRAFCSGADLKAVLRQVLSGEPTALPAFLGRIQRALQVLRELPQPTIAALNGLTLAGGLELAISCDILVASKCARIGDCHSNFGVLPGAGAATLLPRLVGEKTARYLMYTGDQWSATDLQQVGLISRVVAHEELTEAVEALAGGLASKSPLVVRRMKRMVTECQKLGIEDGLALETKLVEEHARSSDMLEGLKAFVEKRKPIYTGA